MLVSDISVPSLDTATQLSRLYHLDLSGPMSKARLTEPEGLGWSDQQCAEASLWYRRFWHAIIVNREERLVPNRPIDELWHLHVLDTAAYRRDCAHVLGYFLDHYPYYGLRGDAAARDDSFEATNRLYRSLFDADCRAMSAFDPSTASQCGGSCAAACGGAPAHRPRTDTTLNPALVASGCGESTEG